MQKTDETDSWYGELKADAGSPDVGCGCVWFVVCAALSALFWLGSVLGRRYDGTPLWQWLAMAAMLLGLEVVLCR